MILLSSRVFDTAGLEFPVTEFSARFPQALAAFLHVLVVCWLGTQMFGRRVGLVAGFIMAASATNLYFSHSALIEMTLVLFTTLSFACFWRATSGDRISGFWMMMFYLSFAGGMMSKFPLPFAFVGLPLAIYWLFGRPLVLRSGADGGPALEGADAGFGSQIRAIGKLWPIPGLLIFLAVSAPWPLYAWSQVDGALALWKTEFFDRFSGQMSAQSDSWWYYIPIVFGFVVPFMMSLPEAVASPFLKRYRDYRHPLVYLLLWGVVGVVFISMSAFKRPHYPAAIMPAFILMLAPVIDRLFLGDHERSVRAIKAACYLVLAVLVGGLIAGLGYVNIFLPQVLRTCVFGAALLALLWCGACVFFRYGYRATSLAMLHLGSLVLIVFGWQAAAGIIDTDEQSLLMAEEFRRLDLGPEDRIVQVDSRVDATTAFYGHLRIERLFTPNEMSSMREGRRGIPLEVKLEAVHRIKEGLTGDPKTYYILQAELFEAFRNATDLPAEEKFRLTGFKANSKDDQVIIGPLDRTLKVLEPDAQGGA
jgi:4-amino-4-deoxy-L-arabinose transferase-like glycosyltransferase